MILCFDGKPGAGKSYAMHENAFRLIETMEKDGLVTNQPIDCRQLYHWAAKRKWRHLMRVALHERVVIEKSLNTLLSYRNTMVLFDEAGIFANSRDWAELKRENPNFIVDLCQVRKGGIDLIWSAQSHDMVDKQLRALTNFYWICGSMGRFYFRNMYDALGIEKRKAGGKYLKYCIQRKFGFFDLDIFKIYDSYVRLEDPNNRGKTVADVVNSRMGFATSSSSQIKFDLVSGQYYIPDPETGEPPENLYPKGFAYR
ncbi:Zonular occludens toxin (Zot) [compost metagenome]